MFLITRLTLEIIGVSSRAAVGPLLASVPGARFFWPQYTSQRGLLDIWGAWDTGWYVDIASHGYSATRNALGQANYNFFPLYPLLMRIVGYAVGGPYVGGLVVSNVCVLITCFTLYRLVLLNDGAEVAARTVRYLFAFPSAFLLSAVLSEPLFLALLVACFYYARMGNWRAAGAFGFLLALTRAEGILAVAPLAYMYALQNRGLPDGPVKATRVWRPDALFLLLIPLGTAAFLFYQYRLTGDFLAYWHIHQSWMAPSNSKLLPSGNDAGKTVNGSLITGLGLSSAAFIMALALLLPNRRHLSRPLWVLALYSVLLPVVDFPRSYAFLRHLLEAFPLYILLAKVNRPDVEIGLAMSQGFFMALWTIGSWVII
ncbi:MAG TPA: hypothetical protein VKT83_03970 [bacterium]|nr:hypothetical protein [bacterium]